MDAKESQETHQKYLEIYHTINKEVKDGFCRFRDIAANLLACDVFIQDNENKFWEYITALKDYFRLLDEYPEFRKDELSKLEGHFPEFGATMDKGTNFDYQAEGFSNYQTHYVNYSKRRLEEIAKESQTFQK